MSKEIYYYLSHTLKCYLFEEYEKGLEYAKEGEHMVNALPGSVYVQNFFFYYALLLAAQFSKEESNVQQQYFRKLLSLHERLASGKDEPSSSAQAHKRLLVAAEVARLSGNDADAIPLYEEAIQTAHTHDFIQEEAIANECIARLYFARDMEQAARSYLCEAYKAYQLCGAYDKVNTLEKQYPHCLCWPAEGSGKAETGNIIHTHARLTSVPTDSWDVAAVIKASQALTQERHFSRVIKKIMTIILEYAGATNGVLLEHAQQQLFVRARGENGDISLEERGEQEPSSQQEQPYPISLIQYVLRTQRPLLANNVAQTRICAGDSYIKQNCPKSALCLPIISQGVLTWVMYLENNLSINAFTEERLELLKVLASQAGVSLENAQWYAQLDREVERRTSELVRAKEEIEAVKERFQAFADATHEGLIIHDQHRIIDVNQPLLRLFHTSRETMLQSSIPDLFAPNWKTQVVTWLEGPPGRVYEATAVNTDRTLFPVEFETRQTHWQGQNVKLTAIRDIRWRRNLETENQTLRAILDERDRFGELIGRSPVMHQVYERLLKAANVTTPIIIYGETGTGKELAARTLFDMSDHHTRCFVAVNCGAIQKNLFEPQFFGYRKGAFTGADQHTGGFVNQAEGGTLFLDEVGELPLDMQVKLLRLLNDKTYTPVGATATYTADVRIIAATNKSLRNLVSQGRMREDFFHRLHVITIEMPPLRLRKEDIPLLVAFFLEEMQSSGKKTPEISSVVMERLLAYDWPGNVRELYNEIHRHIITGELEMGGSQSPPLPDSQQMPFLQPGLTLREAMEAFERFYITNILNRVQQQKGKAAESLQISRKTLYLKLKKMGLDENGKK